MKMRAQRLRKKTTISFESEVETTFIMAPNAAKVKDALRTYRAPAKG
jgi:hypothetical protein